MAVQTKWHGKHLKNDTIEWQKTNKSMFFGKKSNKTFGSIRKSSNFAVANKKGKMTLTANFWWWQSSELKNCESARRTL